MLAFSWPDLIDGDIEVPLNRQPDGSVANTTAFAWTSTDFDGTATQGGINSCQDWTSSGFTAAPRGAIGSNAANWTGGIPSAFGSCSGPNGRLYCFQQ